MGLALDFITLPEYLIEPVRWWAMDLIDEIAQRKEDGADLADRELLRCQAQLQELIQLLPAAERPTSGWVSAL